MRRKESFFEDRNKDLVRAFRMAALKSNCTSQLEILKIAINTPSKRFWVSGGRAMHVVSRLMKGDPLDDMNESRKSLYMEIHRRAIEYRKRPEYRDLSLSVLCDIIVEEEAPRFYITLLTANKCYIFQKGRGKEKWGKKNGTFQ